MLLEQREDPKPKFRPVRLCEAMLKDLPEGIARPSYDRSRLTPGIVHIGVGNFHRAHQAWYLHRLMQQGLAMDWAIIGAGVRPYDAEMRTRLLAQDCLTTLIELVPEGGASFEVIGSMIDYVPVEEGNAALIRQMADPAIRIVSLTVTESGYYINPADSGFDAEHADILRDADDPSAPRTAFGAIIAALKLRRETGNAPFTLQSCDNLQGNGDVLRRTVVSLARMSDPALADWISENAAFPNSMVDCIVPAAGEAELAKARAAGIDDAAPVSHERFRQWVLEDDFRSGRPPWESMDATLTGDVHPYETMKIRILNAGHQVLANLGELLSLPTIDACIADPLVAAFFRKVQTEEILPCVSATPETTPAQYLDLIEQRFANPAIKDTTRRVAFDGSARHTGFVLPIVSIALESGRERDAPISGLALVEALWARMCTGLREDGSTIEPNDPCWEQLHVAAMEARQTPESWLAQRHLYGGVADRPGFGERFAKPFATWLERIYASGCRETVRAYVEE